MDKYIAVDADSVDINIRKMLIKASARTRIKFVFVADRSLKDIEAAGKEGINVEMVIVDTKDDSADDYIVQNADKILFCISHDVGLSTRLASLGLCTIDKRGNITNESNFRQKQSLRDQNMLMKEDGIFLQKVGKRTQKDNQNFANALDKLLTEALKKCCK